MNSRKIVYWIATVVFCALLGLSGLAYLAGVERFVEAITSLGYPPYVLTILGTAKVLGVIALLAPGRPLLKEWAYAGFAFDLIAAVASHTFAGDPIGEAVRPLVPLAIGATSYLLRPESRRLAASPTIPPASVAEQAGGAASLG
jgi:hypothetical protein